MIEYSGKILITGATGFVGGRLVHNLTANGIKVRCLVRSPDKLRKEFSQSEVVDVVAGDLLKPETYENGLEGIEVAFYLVHSMGGRNIGENKVFVQRDQLLGV